MAESRAEHSDCVCSGTTENQTEACSDTQTQEFTNEDIAQRAMEAMMKKMKGRDVLAFDLKPMSSGEWLQQCLKETLSLRAAPQVLGEVSFEGVARHLCGGQCRNVITLAGAGISTSAGIPDYRSSESGVFAVLKEKYQLTDPSEIFSYDYFVKNPAPYFECFKRFFEITPKPTSCHYFLRLLHEKGLLLRHYTQNIDTLERVSGLPAEKVIEAHGSFFTAHCMACQQQYSVNWVKERVMSDRIPKCEKGRCQGLVKPDVVGSALCADIVMYGEPLPPRFIQHVEQDFPKCDLLIIMGTSLIVQPFASLISKVRVSTPRVYINLDNGGMNKRDMGVVFGGGLYFDCPGNLTDVFKQAKCDDACMELADLMGWGEELRSMVKREHQRIDGQQKTSATGTTRRPTVGTKHVTVGKGRRKPAAGQ